MSAISTTSPRERLHALDNVRGLAAVAVVALHSCYAYAAQSMPGLVWPVPIDEPSPVADALFWSIEGCIMPLFFVLSGYFLAQSLTRQSPIAVLKNRTRRLLLPMATVGLVILTLDLHVWVLGLITTDRATISNYRRLKFAPDIQSDLFGPAHLWYVQYLWLLCVTICGLSWLKSRISAAKEAAPPDLIPLADASPSTTSVVVRTSILAVVTALVLSATPEVVLGFQHGWIPNPAKLGHAAIFVAAGTLLWSREGRWLDAVRKATPVSLIVAVGSFTTTLPLIHDAPRRLANESWSPSLGLLLTIFAFSATLAVIGLGLAFLNRQNRLLTHLAAASFWIYLVHHPLVGLIQILVRPLSAPPEAKALIVFGVVTTICSATFVYLVQGRALEQLLEGRWPGSKADAIPQAAEPTTAAPERKAA